MNRFTPLTDNFEIATTMHGTISRGAASCFVHIIKIDPRKCVQHFRRFCVAFAGFVSHYVRLGWHINETVSQWSSGQRWARPYGFADEENVLVVNRGGEWASTKHANCGYQLENVELAELSSGTF